MSTKICYSCGGELQDDDKVVAAMVTVYHVIPSGVAYAVEQPTDCLGIVHFSCYGPEETDDTDLDVTE